MIAALMVVMLLIASPVWSATTPGEAVPWYDLAWPSEVERHARFAETHAKLDALNAKLNAWLQAHGQRALARYLADGGYKRAILHQLMGPVVCPLWRWP